MGKYDVTVMAKCETSDRVAEAAKCSSSTLCANITGDCCPNAEGVYLSCCFGESIRQCTSPKHKACNSMPSQPFEDCCPGTDGLFQPCCSTTQESSSSSKSIDLVV